VCPAEHGANAVTTAAGSDGVRDNVLQLELAT
jgi:hypothetical protein